MRTRLKSNRLYFIVKNKKLTGVKLLFVDILDSEGDEFEDAVFWFFHRVVWWKFTNVSETFVGYIIREMTVIFERSEVQAQLISG
jgi:hypothetical protein